MPLARLLLALTHHPDSQWNHAGLKDTARYAYFAAHQTGLDCWTDSSSSTWIASQHEITLVCCSRSRISSRPLKMPMTRLPITQYGATLRMMNFAHICAELVQSERVGSNNHQKSCRFPTLDGDDLPWQNTVTSRYLP